MTIKLNIEQVEELIKCRDDIKYFKTKYLGLSPDTIQDKSLDLIENNRFLNIDTGCQTKKTYTALIYIIHKLIFNTNKTLAIVSSNYKSSKNKISIITKMLDKLPDFFKHNLDIKMTKILNKGCNNILIIDLLDNNTLKGVTADFILVEEGANAKNREKHIKQNIIASMINRSSKVVILGEGINSKLFYVFRGETQIENIFKYIVRKIKSLIKV